MTEGVVYLVAVLNISNIQIGVYVKFLRGCWFMGWFPFCFRSTEHHDASLVQLYNFRRESSLGPWINIRHIRLC